MTPRAARVLSALVACLASCSSGSSSQTSSDGGSDAPVCGPARGIPPYVRSAGAETTFPDGFLFGAASAGMQIEKGLVHADWYQWAKIKGHVQNDENPDDGPDAFAHFDDDVQGLVDAGANAYRFSIEWSRIFPTRAQFDADTPDAPAVAAYHSLLGKLRAKHIRPFVTLHHFATPDWLDDLNHPEQPQGFERDTMKADFAKWATWAGKEFGAEVDDWVTINEPVVLVLGAYVGKKHPPGSALDLDRMFAAVKQIARVHVAAFDALHAADTVDAGSGHPVWVSMAKHNRLFLPNDPCEPDDVAAAAQSERVWNLWLYDAVVLGDWDDDFDGKLDGPNDKQGDASLKGRADYVGVNYYGDTLVSGSLKLQYLGGLPSYEGLSDDLAKTDMNWDVFPQGIRPVLRELKKYRLPIVITENGIGDQQDKNKARYLAEHLWEVGRAIADDGLDVQGYFYWSLTDNFEWDHGFCPRFGLYRIDYSTPARTRSPTSAVAQYKRISNDRKLTASSIDALPAYAVPVVCHAP